MVTGIFLFTSNSNKQKREGIEREKLQFILIFSLLLLFTFSGFYYSI